jgi:hypothetical protein
MDHPVPWEGVVAASMPWFVERFTLHDSGLQSITTDWEGRTLLKIHFDLHWNPSVPDGHTTLWIRFDHPYRVVYTRGGWGQPTLEGVQSQALDNQQREVIRAGTSFDPRAYQLPGTEFGSVYPPDDDGLTSTMFSLMNWGTLALLHATPVRFAVASSETASIDLTSLNVRPP